MSKIEWNSEVSWYFAGSKSGLCFLLVLTLELGKFCQWFFSSVTVCERGERGGWLDINHSLTNFHLMA